KLGARRQADAADVEQQLARAAQAFVNTKRAVEKRVVDITLPTHGGPWLFEIHAHHDQQIVAQFVSSGLQEVRVFKRLVMIVNRARSADGDQPVVTALQDVGYFNAALFDQRLH